MNELLNVIHEDDELLVIDKPAGLVCHPTKADEYSSLISRVRLYLGKETRPHLVNRLDRETSGVTIVAKRDDAALDLRRIWESRAAQKEYLAIVRGHVREESGLIDAPLGKDQQSAVAIRDGVRPDGLPSQTKFYLEQHFERAEGRFSLLRLLLLTGRKHQIRIHLSHIGHPIVGDKLYGGDETIYLDFVAGRLTEEQRKFLLLANQALHANAMKFVWHGKEVAFHAEPEAEFKAFIPSDCV